MIVSIEKMQGPVVTIAMCGGCGWDNRCEADKTAPDSCPKCGGLAISDVVQPVAKM